MSGPDTGFGSPGSVELIVPRYSHLTVVVPNGGIYLVLLSCCICYGTIWAGHDAANQGHLLADGYNSARDTDLSTCWRLRTGL